MKMSINNYVARQLGKPTGLGGKIVTAVMNRQNLPLYEEIVQLLSLCGFEKILDIGCGNGYVLKMLAESYNCDFVGIDISESILKTATKRNRRFVQSGKMSFECHSVDKMPFGSDIFDKVYTINTVYFWDDLSATMAEIKRVLKQGGIFINALYTNDTLARFSHTQFGYKRFAPEYLVSAAENAGFSAKLVHINNGVAYCVVCSL
jgi:ubiquinone/menaquinone biosynthesis C-methylase UbiE